MIAALTILIDVFGEPSAAFKALKNRPRWLVVFVVISLIAIGSAWAILPFTQEIAHAKMLSSGMDEAQIDRAQEITGKFSFIGLFFAPVALLIKWLLFSGLLYLAAGLLAATEELRFKTVYASVVHAELILVLAGLVNAALLLYFRDVDAIESVADLQVIPGLHFLLADGADNIRLATFLSHINPFTIWYIVVLTSGVSIVAEFSKVKAGMLATTVWLLSVLLQVALIGFSSARFFLL